MKSVFVKKIITLLIVGFVLSPLMTRADNSMCARHGAVLGGESPLSAVEIGRTSLGKGVHREVESEGSR